MTRFMLFLAFLLVPAQLQAQAPDFTGSFSMAGQNGTIVLTLQPSGNGQYAGTMSNGGLTWQLKGEIYEDALTGTVDTGQGILAFEAYVDAAELNFILVPIGQDGLPLVNDGEEFVFSRVRGEDTSATPSPSSSFPGFSQGANEAAAADPFIGDFTDGELTLSLQGQAGRYSGNLALGAESFPVVAERKGDIVEGMMNAPTGQYGIVIAASADGVVISNAGNNYTLKRISAGQSGSGSRGLSNAGQPAQQSGAAAGQGQTDNSPLAQQWRAHLAGKKVTYLDSYSSNTAGGGGFSTKFVYHLCSDGRFGYSGSDVVSVNLPGTGVEGGGNAGSSSGNWRIITQGQLAGIELRFGNGQVETYQLGIQDGQTFANGSRVYVTPGELCN